jgi:hypothetical protein
MVGDDTDGRGPDDVDGSGEDGDRERVWLVERTYSDDEQNVVILTYATPDGRRTLRKERALTSFDDDRPTTAAVEAAPKNLGVVDDPETVERYRTEVARMRAGHEPNDEI